MARTDDDAWDVAVKAVVLDSCNRMADGALDFDAYPLLGERQVCERIAVRTRFFDDFFTAAGTATLNC